MTSSISNANRRHFVHIKVIQLNYIWLLLENDGLIFVKIVYNIKLCKFTVVDCIEDYNGDHFCKTMY